MCHKEQDTGLPLTSICTEIAGGLCLLVAGCSKLPAPTCVRTEPPSSNDRLADFPCFVPTEFGFAAKMSSGVIRDLAIPQEMSMLDPTIRNFSYAAIDEALEVILDQTPDVNVPSDLRADDGGDNNTSMRLAYIFIFVICIPASMILGYVIWIFSTRTLQLPDGSTGENDDSALGESREGSNPNSLRDSNSGRSQPGAPGKPGPSILKKKYILADQPAKQSATLERAFSDPIPVSTSPHMAENSPMPTPVPDSSMINPLYQKQTNNVQHTISIWNSVQNQTSGSPVQQPKQRKVPLTPLPMSPTYSSDIISAL